MRVCEVWLDSRLHAASGFPKSELQCRFITAKQIPKGLQTVENLAETEGCKI